eukprot:COSAG06_NODE_1642_length_8827_cov_26.657997_4_plen_66_part_00
MQLSMEETTPASPSTGMGSSARHADAEGRVYRHPAPTVDVTVGAADPGAMNAVARALCKNAAANA